MATSSQTFFTELQKSEQQGPVFLTREFVSAEKQGECFDTLNDGIPWDLEPLLYGERLTQHAYLYNRTRAEQSKHIGLALIESLCLQLEESFDGKVDDVFCNRFQDDHHMIDWHEDTYGRHIFVLSLGSTRCVEFRKKKSNEIIALKPGPGDLYFMPLKVNETHQHRVCPRMPSDGEGPRISLVFFFKTPKYAKEYRITRRQKIRGAWESFLENIM